MTNKKAIKQMMAVVVPSDTARMCSYIVTSFRLTNGGADQSFKNQSGVISRTAYQNETRLW